MPPSPPEPVPSGLMALPISHGSVGLRVLNMPMPISKHTFTLDFKTSLTGVSFTPYSLYPIKDPTPFLKVLIEIYHFSQKFCSRFAGGGKAIIRTWRVLILTLRHCHRPYLLFNLSHLLPSFPFPPFLYLHPTTRTPVCLSPTPVPVSLS